ncbi:MAG: glycosyltransferase family 4 protein [bacterium]
MKIGHLIHLDGSGGGPEAVINLMRGFQLAGHEQVVFLGGNGRIVAACDRMAIECVRVPIHRKILLLWGMIRLIRSLSRIRPDVLLIQGQWGGPVGAVAAKMAGVKSVYITQWPAFYTDWTPWRAFRNAWAEWIPCRLACRVVALTQSVYYQYLHRRWAGDGKLVLIPNVFQQSGIPSLEDSARIRREYGWSHDDVHVVSVGRLADQKRVDWLLKAWQEVQQHCAAARLWIVGDGPERAMLEGLARQLGITRTCTFLGERPHGIEFMAASDVVVMTSLYESCAFVPLEAKACGKPLIANAVDGVRDNVRDGVDGYLVAPNDSATLALRIMEVVNDPLLRHQMGVAGIAAMAKIDSHQIIIRYLDLINKTLCPAEQA